MFDTNDRSGDRTHDLKIKSQQFSDAGQGLNDSSPVTESAEFRRSAAEDDASTTKLATTPAIASQYSWLARSSFVLGALLLVSCTAQDSRVVAYRYQTSAADGRLRVAADGPTHLEAVPAYYLIAEDHAQCEVDSTAYVNTAVGRRVACDWSQP